MEFKVRNNHHNTDINQTHISNYFLIMANNAHTNDYMQRRRDKTKPQQKHINER